MTLRHVCVVGVLIGVGASSCLLVPDDENIISGRLTSDLGCYLLFDDHTYELHRWEGPKPPLGSYVSLRVEPIRDAASICMVGEMVDVLCSIGNDALGPGGSGTATIAKRAKVIARYGSTRTAYNAPPELRQQDRVFVERCRPGARRVQVRGADDDPHALLEHPGDDHRRVVGVRRSVVDRRQQVRMDVDHRTARDRRDIADSESRGSSSGCSAVHSSA